MRGREPEHEGAYLSEAFAREAVDFITHHRDVPFFLYVPFNAVHTPLAAPDEHLARFAHIANRELRTYYAMASALDDAVGAILRAIDGLGLAERTLVVFTSDNGGPLPLADNAPLRLGKGFLFEGGIRVPMIMRWPGVTQAGHVQADTVSTLDLFPTFLAAADVPLPVGLALDGVDLAPSLRGEQSGALHEHLFWRNGPNRAVRSGDWKLVQAGDHVWLFDLATDVWERTNLASVHPTVVQALLDALTAWEAGLEPPRWLSFRWPAMVDGAPYEIHL
jgi:arylsulfatase A-like enzyme